MKRKREIEKVSEIRSAINEVSLVLPKPKNGGDHQVHDAAGAAAVPHIPTKPFLSVCNLIIQVLDKIGPTMTVLRQDISQNIQRLEKFHEVDPSLYSNVVEILKKEVADGNSKKRTSCSKAFLWLTRTLDFMVALLQLLVKDFGLDMEQAVEEAYKITLKPWHGWISSAAYRVALKLVPDNETLITILMNKHDDHDTFKKEVHTLISLFVPFLEEMHLVLRTYGIDRLKSN